jgi:hypothetical protein
MDISKYKVTACPVPKKFVAVVQLLRSYDGLGTRYVSLLTGKASLNEVKT